MGQKIRVQGGPEQGIGQTPDSLERSIAYKDDETRKIAGYTCRKAVITSKMGGEEQKQTVWYTPKIQGVHNSFPDLKGFPLKFTDKVRGMTKITKADTVEEKSLGSAYFDTNPEGYKTQTWEEFQQNFGRGMGGG